MKEGSRRQIWAWSVYDLANTLYSAIFLSFSFPLLVKNYLGGDEGHVGMAAGGAAILSGIAVPFVGALSDKIGRRMPFIIFFTLVSCAAASFVGFSDLRAAVALAVLANFCYATSLAVYDALLPKLAPRGGQGAVSGLGVAVGYIGTPVAYGAAAVIFLYCGETEFAMRLTFAIPGLFFLLVSLYPFFVIREPRTPSGRTFGQEVHASFASIAASLRVARTIPGYIPFMFASLFMLSAMMTIIIFFSTYQAETLKLSLFEILLVNGGLAIPTAAGAWGLGKLADRVGERNVMLIAGGCWMIAFAAMIFTTSLPVFIVVGSIGGVGLGGIRAAIRPLLTRFADPEKMGEYFGFLALVDKAGIIIGPPVFGLITARWGYPAGIVALMVFMGVGMACLSRVKRQAR